jgi:hypothetical protein
MVTEDGECYEGEWFADMHIGEGKYTTQNSQIITVTPKHHGEEVGRTILYSSETPVRVGENIYIGPWKNGLRHGFGVY